MIRAMGHTDPQTNIATIRLNLPWAVSVKTTAFALSLTDQVAKEKFRTHLMRQKNQKKNVPVNIFYYNI